MIKNITSFSLSLITSNFYFGIFVKAPGNATSSAKLLINNIEQIAC